MARVSIPGKLMLSGEYAVLYGAPAVLVPVPRYLHLETAVPPAGEPLSALPPALQSALKHPIRRLEQYEDEQRVQSVSVDSSEFYTMDEGRQVKLGLGLSAAESVGGIALRYEAAGLSWQAHRMELAQAAIAAHFSVSQGGSGADSAACALGRPIRYQLTEGGPQIEPLGDGNEPARATLPLNCIWSRRSADTRLLLAEFERWVDAEPARAAELIEPLCQRSAMLAPLWFGADAAALLEAIDAFNAALRECTNAAGMSYLLPAHARMEEWARRHGGRAKPTGAGGGDMILFVGELPLSQLSMDVLQLA